MSVHAIAAGALGSNVVADCPCIQQLVLATTHLQLSMLNSLPLKAGFFPVAPEALGANVVAVSLANLLTCVSEAHKFESELA